MTETEALQRMHAVAPIEWWQFVPCGVCNSARQEQCRKGGGKWPEPLGRPHARRRAAGLDLHATLWLLRNFPGDVMGGES